MECIAVTPQSAAAVQGSLCMNCDVRARCVGGVAAEAGTAQVRALLAGRRTLRTWEVLYGPDEPFQQVYVVRSGALKSSTQRHGGEKVLGFHFAGELVGLDGLADGRHRATATALEETQVCVLRFAPRGGEGAGARALLARLWDMMSCELLRESAHRGLLATLPGARRVSAFVASAAARMRKPGRGAAALPVAVQHTDLASYLGVSTDTVQLALRREAALPL